MAQSRKDNKGRVLRKGETQRSCDGKYVYTYTDVEGKRRSIYSKDILELQKRDNDKMKKTVLLILAIVGAVAAVAVIAYAVYRYFAPDYLEDFEEDFEDDFDDDFDDDFFEDDEL